MSRQRRVREGDAGLKKRLMVSMSALVAMVAGAATLPGSAGVPKDRIMDVGKK